METTGFVDWVIGGVLFMFVVGVVYLLVQKWSGKES